MEECGPCPVFASFTLAFALQLRKKYGKTSVTVQYTHYQKHPHITKPSQTHTLQNPLIHIHAHTHTTKWYDVCAVSDSWWWTERPSETCRVSFQNKINSRYCASGWFYYRNQWCVYTLQQTHIFLSRITIRASISLALRSLSYCKWFNCFTFII